MSLLEASLNNSKVVHYLNTLFAIFSLSQCQWLWLDLNPWHYDNSTIVLPTLTVYKYT